MSFYYLLCNFFIQILGTVTVFSFNIALALKKTNFVNRNVGHFNKFVLLPLCQPCIQFCLLKKELLALNNCDLKQDVVLYKKKHFLHLTVVACCLLQHPVE